MNEYSKKTYHNKTWHRNHVDHDLNQIEAMDPHKELLHDHVAWHHPLSRGTIQIHVIIWKVKRYRIEIYDINKVFYYNKKYNECPSQTQIQFSIRTSQ